jgi:membrane protein
MGAVMRRRLLDHARAAWDTTWTAMRLFVADQGLTWAGAIGLYLFLSVPPFMVAVTWAASPLFGTDGAAGFVVEQVSKYLPARQELLEGIVTSAPDSLGGAVASIAFLLVSASRAFAAMTSAINVLWRRVDRLTFGRRQLLRVGMVALALALLLLAGLAEAGLNALAGGDGSESGFWLIDWQLLPSLLLFLFLTVSYKILPREPVSRVHAAIGALAATVGIRLAQAGTGILAERGTFETPYGELAGVALMATWALVVGIIILWCAALVAAFDGKRPEDGEGESRFTRSA